MINCLVILTFRYGENTYKIKYSSGFKVICIPKNRSSEERKKMLCYTPSTLGMDILIRFRRYINRRTVKLELIENKKQR